MKLCWLIALAFVIGSCADAANAKCRPPATPHHVDGKILCLYSIGAPSSGSVVVTLAGQGVHGPYTKAQAAAELAKRRKHRWH